MRDRLLNFGFPVKKVKDDSAERANAYQAEVEAAGHARIRARGRNAIKQVRAVLRKAGDPIPAGLRLPEPKGKLKKKRS